MEGISRATLLTAQRIPWAQTNDKGAGQFTLEGVLEAKAAEEGGTWLSGHMRRVHKT